MKKKKILYSELTSAAAPAPVAAMLTPVTATLSPVAAAPMATPALEKLAPVQLARALAAARATEAAPVVAPVVARSTTPVPAPPPHIARLITPLRGVSRITPLRGTRAVPVARTLRERVRGRSGNIELLLFRVGSERFAIELSAVEEAIDLPPVHHVPEMPPAMVGVITVRGTLTPVYSPQAALGLALTDGASALIFKRGRHRFALVIDDVEDVMTLDLATLRDAPDIEDSESVLLGVVRQHDSLLALVDTETLLATCQAVPLLETA